MMTENNSVVVADEEAEIILPPPSPLNPIPSLPAALRVDNREQLLALLQSDPRGITQHGTPHQQVSSSVPSHTTTTFRQLLVFGTESLRTLLLRQVLSDPHSRSVKGKKKNWDMHNTFQFPRSLSIIGTRVLVPIDRSETWDSDVTGSVDVVNYFLRPWDLVQTQNAAQQIRTWKTGSSQITPHHRLIYVPQPTAMIQKILRNLGLISLPHVSVVRLQMDVYPLESDVFSLEFDHALKEFEVEGTPSLLCSTVARSILKIQDIVGPIPRVQSYGPLGEEIVKKLLNLTVDEYLSARDPPEDESGPVTGGDVATLVIFDRKIDFVTPMLTPLIYEGLLDELLGIDCGFVTVNESTINPDDDLDEKQAKPNSQKDLVALSVNGSDALYVEVRDQHVEKFGSFLQNQAKALRESHANFTSHGTKKDLSEIHQFVKQIPVFTQNLRSLTNHIHLAELVKKTSEEATFRERWQTERSILEGETCYELLDDLVASQYPPHRFFRLLCLQSLCSGGIRSSRYDSLRRDVVQTYGFVYLFVLNNLEKAGLVRRREGLWMDTASPFNNLRKSLILINADVDTVDPDDISYVSSGYAPLTVRLLQTAIKGWRTREDVLREIPGRLIDITQQIPPEDLVSALKRPMVNKFGSLSVESGEGGRKPVMIVLYVGGVTFMELAALRFLSKRQTFPYHIICVTTKIINGNTLLETLC